MTDTHRLSSFLRRVGTTLLAGLVSLMRIVQRLLLSARAWVLFVLSIIAALVLYYVLADRHTPFTTDAYVQAYVVQVAARVEGQVVGVYVQENQAVKKDELLFEIDPRPFEYRVALLEAKRVDAIQQVAQMESELSAAKAEDTRLVAEEAFARTVYEQETAIYKQKATTDRKYVDAVQKYSAAQAARQRGVAQTHKVEQALAARIGEEHALVAAVRAQLDEARLNVDWTRIFAPANGYVTNVQLRVGAYAHVGMPVITFIDGDQWWVVANYRENSLAKLRPEESTALYDAVVYSLYNFLGVKGQKALVLLTDGKDTVSKFSYEQALEYAQRAAVPIYAIGVGIRVAELDVKSKLNRLCSETGGSSYYIDNATELGKIYTDIQNELRSQYVLGFYPGADVKNGSKWREVSVQVADGKVKTIRGYYP